MLPHLGSRMGVPVHVSSAAVACNQRHTRGAVMLAVGGAQNEAHASAAGPRVPAQHVER